MVSILRVSSLRISYVALHSVSRRFAPRCKSGHTSVMVPGLPLLSVMTTCSIILLTVQPDLSFHDLLMYLLRSIPPLPPVFGAVVPRKQRWNIQVLAGRCSSLGDFTSPQQYLIRLQLHMVAQWVWLLFQRGLAIPAVSGPRRGFVRVLHQGHGSGLVSSIVTREPLCRDLRTIAKLSVGCPCPCFLPLAFQTSLSCKSTFITKALLTLSEMLTGTAQ